MLMLYCTTDVSLVGLTTRGGEVYRAYTWFFLEYVTARARAQTPFASQEESGWVTNEILVKWSQVSCKHHWDITNEIDL